MITKISEALKLPANQLVDLEGHYLIVKTLQDGFTGTYAGQYIYQIRKGLIEKTTGVFPTVWDKANSKWIVDPFTEDTKFPTTPKFDNAPKYNPIVMSIDTTVDSKAVYQVHGVARAFTDPYNLRGVTSAEVDKSITNSEGEANKILLQMFVDFADNEFRIGHYNLFITDEVVIDDAVVLVPATNVTLNKSTLSLVVGAKETLTATVTPSNTTDAKVFSSTASAVASVSATGEVTAKTAGTADIVVTVGTKTAKATVTVTEE